MLDSIQYSRLRGIKVAKAVMIPTVQHESNNIRELRGSFSTIGRFVYFAPFPPFAPGAAPLGGVAGAGLVVEAPAAALRATALWTRAVNPPLPMLPPDLACNTENAVRMIATVDVYAAYLGRLDARGIGRSRLGASRGTTSW